MESRPPVPTIGELQKASRWLWLYCAADCGHHKPLALAPFVIRWGAEEIDIWRAAHLLMKRHGVDAAIVAAQRADELFAQGATDGQRIWKRIAAAVHELRCTKPAAGERRN